MLTRLCQLEAQLYEGCFGGMTMDDEDADRGEEEEEEGGGERPPFLRMFSVVCL